MSSPLLPLAALLVITTVVVALLVAVLAAGVTPRDVVWLAGAHVGAEPAEVYRRYLARHRAHRLVGAVLGLAFAVVYGITWQGRVEIGIGSGSPLGDLLFMGLAGVLAGALSAETFRLTEPRSMPVLASLGGRRSPVAGHLVALARGATVLALVGGSVTLVVAHDASALAVATVAALLVGIAEATRAAVTGRRRPLLSEAAAEVDLKIRDHAWRALAHLELSAACLAVGWLTAKLPGAGLFWLQVPVVLLSLAAAVVELHRARPRPPRSFAMPRHPVTEEVRTA